ncbi:MmcQ/YjbR family DNA-binding protein [Pedobacter sp. BS3]|uniref:MmcQ/YjbR family DNA-binding protein n=1 Tax=Pedobacter sp. BS3 TaxID=2567937 RepID=UPI0011EBAE10|nr:MmcQ/YjbR family DNA-binding protein [Pedobacter sp. BS3]TZF83660.1 MmcQ/YjbR family DNA-binding protein [Pedobacter sp. BS3]
MDIETLRDYCLSKPAVEECMPFGDDTLVFKVAGKIFLLAPLSTSLSMNVKCDPELAVELREKHPEVKPGYHMNKKMWNTVDLTGTLSDKQITGFIDHSYQQVVAGLPKKIQQEILSAG